MGILLVNDESENGCWCSEEDLRGMVKDLFAQVQSRVQPAQIAQVDQPNSRPRLIKAVFDASDTDGMPGLSSEEMCRFARMMGFDGSAQDWKTEFQTLISWHGEPIGDRIDLPLFTELVNDTTDNGCYC